MSEGLTSSEGAADDIASGMLHAFVLCDLSVLPRSTIAAASAASDAEAASATATLTAQGWLELSRPDVFSVPPGRWLSLRNMFTRCADGTSRARVRRLARHLQHGAEAADVDLVRAGHVTPLAYTTTARSDYADSGQSAGSGLTWVRDHHPQVPGVIRHCVRFHAAELAVDVATVWWRLACFIPEPTWHRRLADEGERAAISARSPSALADLLSASARDAEGRGDLPAAERQWVRALAIWRELADNAKITDVLGEMGSLYWRWQRWHRAMDTYLDLVVVHDGDGDTHSALSARRNLGEVMLFAERPEAAVQHLSRAEELADSAAGFGDTDRGELLVLLGRAQWSAGLIGLARRSFSRALALFVDDDERQADYVRTLLATAGEASLPAQPTSADR